MPRILAGTRDGLVTVELDGRLDGRLEGHSVRAVAPASGKALWAAVDGYEIWRGDGAGAEWAQVTTLGALGEPGLRAECVADTRANAEDGVLVGTSRAHLARVAGDRIERVESFDRAPGRDRWFTPWGGPPDVRSITEDAGAVYVNVHVGGVLRSRDGGATWAPTIELGADVHRVVTGAGRVYAAGARGLSVSQDGGDAWRTSSRGLHAAYCRSVAVCGSTLLLSASDGPGGGRAALYRSGVEGTEFERCRNGLPEWFDGNIDSLCVDAVPDGALAAFATESGDLYASTDEGVTWSEAAAGLGTINCVLVLP